MSKYLVSDTQLTSVANAIRTKGGTSNSLSFPDGFVSAIGNIPSGGSTPSSGPVVKFYDYDGTLITTKTKDEVNAMTSDSDLPANPSHTGLVAEGWNWTVSELKAQLLACPESDIIVGQTYDTASGDTEIDITLTSLELLSPSLAIRVVGEITINWGDNTESLAITGNSSTDLVSATHTYINIGSYTISIHLVSGYFVFGSGVGTVGLLYESGNISSIDYSRAYSSGVKHIRVSSSCNKIDSYTCNMCYGLKTLIISKSIGIKIITLNSFYNAASLECVIIPNGFTQFSNYAFYNNLKLETVSIPASITDINQYIFTSCKNLQNITIPYNVKTIGTGCFNGCPKLKFIELPSNITSFGNSIFSGCHNLETVISHSTGINLFGTSTFQNCYTLRRLVFPNSNKCTTIGNNTFNACYSLESFTIPNTVTSIGSSSFSSACLENIIIPNSVTTINGTNAFASNQVLTEVTIPSSITGSISNSTFGSCSALRKVTISEGVKQISGSMFVGCYSLADITIPSTVTSIGAKAFSSCKCLRKVVVLNTTPPTLSNANTFENCHPSLKIYVPYSADHSILNDYMTANYWSTYASKMEELPASTT